MFSASSTQSTFCTTAPARKETLLARIVAWEANRKQMVKLTNMTETQLKDIGLTKADVERETALNWTPPIQLRRSFPKV